MAKKIDIEKLKNKEIRLIKKLFKIMDKHTAIYKKVDKTSMYTYKQRDDAMKLSAEMVKISKELVEIGRKIRPKNN